MILVRSSSDSDSESEPECKPIKLRDNRCKKNRKKKKGQKKSNDEKDFVERRQVDASDNNLQSHSHSVGTRDESLSRVTTAVNL